MDKPGLVFVRWSVILLFVIYLLLVSGAVSGQQKTPLCDPIVRGKVGEPTDKKVSSTKLPKSNGNKALYELESVAVDGIVPLGKQIVIQLLLKNFSSDEIFVLQSDPIRDYEIKIEDGNKKTVPLSAKGQETLSFPASGSRTLIQIPAGEESCRPSVVANELYDLPAGRYIITVSTRILLKDHKVVHLQSNPVSIEVVQLKK